MVSLRRLIAVLSQCALPFLASFSPILAQVEWQEVLQADSTGFGAPFFLKDSLGWVYFSSWSSKRGLLRTVDGGDTWDTVRAPFNGLPSLFFPDEVNGWMYNGPGGYLHKTTDGGETWNEVSEGFPAYRGGKIGPNALFFANESVGWAACDYAVVLRTTDGGKSWLPESPMKTEVGYRDFADIDFVDDSVGWAVGGWNIGIMAQTTDGGVTWVGNHLDDEFSGFQMTNVSFGSRMWGMAAGFNNIQQTFDGGETWEKVQSFGPEHWGSRIHFTDIELLDDSYGWVTGHYYDSAVNPVAVFVSITSDRGATWESYEFPELTESVGISVVSRSLGFLVGGSGGSMWRYQLPSDVREDVGGDRALRLDLRP